MTSSVNHGKLMAYPKKNFLLTIARRQKVVRSIKQSIVSDGKENDGRIKVITK